MTTILAPSLNAPGRLPTPVGVAALTRAAFEGADMIPVQKSLVRRALDDQTDAAALMDLAVVKMLVGQREDALILQARAIELAQIHRSTPAAGPAGLRLLAFTAPGDFMANTPLPFLLEDSDVAVDTLYVAPGLPIPDQVPDHDVAFVAVGESDDNRPVLDQLADALKGWPRPVLNDPCKTAALSRDGATALLQGASGVLAPAVLRATRDELHAVVLDEDALQTLLPGGLFPIIVRPVGSHAGVGLQRISDAHVLQAYLEAQEGDLFYISPYVDYAGADGLFRKARIAFIGAEVEPCHLAVSERWMVHYLNAGMAEDQDKRAEEALFFATFHEAQGFGGRHAKALAEVRRRIGLDYFAIDCAETRDGRLLVFETDVAMIVHALDPEGLYPYKKPQMRRVFAAFRRLLEAARTVETRAA